VGNSCGLPIGNRRLARSLPLARPFGPCLLSSGNPFRRFPSGSSQQGENLRYGNWTARWVHGKPTFASRMHWDHEPRREKGPLSPTLSPSEGARERHRQRALQFGRFMESPVSLSRMHWDHEPGAPESLEIKSPFQFGGGQGTARPTRFRGCASLGISHWSFSIDHLKIFLLKCRNRRSWHVINVKPREFRGEKTNIETNYEIRTTCFSATGTVRTPR